jgi:hypothetical protein
MRSNLDSDRNSPRRAGACHRCGWAQPLYKVGRSQRPLQHADRTCRWICADCIDDISLQVQPSPALPGASIRNDRPLHHTAA